VIAAEVPLLNRLLSRAPLARLRDVAFAAACRLHLVRLDRTRADRAQLRTLLGLVHRARRGRFGRAHDFARVRTAADYRRLVPLRAPAALAREAEIDPVGLTACHRWALRTAFAILHAAAPRAKLLHGKIACDEHRRPHLPLLARPSLDADGAPACLVDDDSVSLTQNGTGVGLLTRPEAPIAVEDVRFGGMRLLVDHGVYFEFVPVGQSTRLTIAETKAGESYELAVTSPGGWWACRSGLFVAFERLSPPIVRLVDAPVQTQPATAPSQARLPAVTPEHPALPAPHPWSMHADRR
jgi:hypothetical protein